MGSGATMVGKGSGVAGLGTLGMAVTENGRGWR